MFLFLQCGNSELKGRICDMPCSFEFISAARIFCKKNYKKIVTIVYEVEKKYYLQKGTKV